ncbi:hypothetical protein [Orrella sp. 11846]|uniref:hypothetical protein n=1 Tax=Orrella sp. 11846 TaxID=3409913 RepID=UPI003B5C7208
MKPLLIHTLILSGVLVGCSSPVYHDTDPNRHIITLDGKPISVVSTGTDQWRAWGGGSARHNESDPSQLNRQLKAIELVSGCRVIQSTQNPDDARQLDASVDCQDSVGTIKAD